MLPQGYPLHGVLVDYKGGKADIQVVRNTSIVTTGAKSMHQLLKHGTYMGPLMG